MDSIQLSVSVLTYNRGHNGYLRTAMDAILAQTYADFELLVIDNHSSDETAEIVLSYRDRRLTYIRLPPGGTPAESFGKIQVRQEKQMAFISTMEVPHPRARVLMRRQFQL